jgi:hypothetical protein
MGLAINLLHAAVNILFQSYSHFTHHTTQLKLRFPFIFKDRQIKKVNMNMNAARVGKKKNPYKNLFGKPAKKRSFAKPLHMWRYVSMYLN